MRYHYFFSIFFIFLVCGFKESPAYLKIKKGDQKNLNTFAYLSQAIYTPSLFFRTAKKNASYEQNEIILETPNGDYDGLLFDYKLENSKHLAKIIILKGTTTADDKWNNFKMELIPFDKNNPELLAHEGFLKKASRLFKIIKKKINKKTPLYLTGHSQGAALAILMSALFKREEYLVHEVYAFSTPKIGNAALIRFIEKNNKNDWLKVIKNKYDPVNDVMPSPNLLDKMTKAPSYEHITFEFRKYIDWLKVIFNGYTQNFSPSITLTSSPKPKHNRAYDCITAILEEVNKTYKRNEENFNTLDNKKDFLRLFYKTAKHISKNNDFNLERHCYPYKYHITPIHTLYGENDIFCF